MLSHGGDEDDILILQGHIGLSTTENAFEIDGDDLLGAVGLYTTHHRT